jgi:hypothetical protein
MEMSAEYVYKVFSEKPHEKEIHMLNLWQITKEARIHNWTIHCHGRNACLDNPLVAMVPIDHTVGRRDWYDFFLVSQCFVPFCIQMQGF